MGEWWWRVPASPTSAPGGCRRGSPGKKKEKEVGRLLFCFGDSSADGVGERFKSGLF